MKRFFSFAICCLLSLQLVQANTLPQSGLYSNTADTVLAVNPIATTPSPYSNSIFKIRLDSIQKEIQLDYNEYVQNYIELYTRHRDEMSQVLGLSKYYFPMYEKIFREAGIPTEIKYLSIVESKLDPNAVSRVGATGPWQFMAATAKIYGLNMDGFVDERKDPIQSCYAAAAYLKDAYQEFGDWLVAIASYNCGKSNVERAITKAGAIDFWSIRQYLPPETRGYVPAFIAMSYVMNYSDKHGIPMQPWALATKTDTILVDKHIPLSNIAKAIGVEMKELALFNPAYKKNLVHGTTAAPRRIVIPNNGPLNNAVLYEALNNPNAIIAQQPAQRPIVIMPAIVPAAVNATAVAALALPPPVYKEEDLHVVKRGESWVDIASNSGVDIADLKEWNHTRAAKPPVGVTLKLVPPNYTPASTSLSVIAPPVKKVASTTFITYKVQPGDTISGIAGKFDGSTAEGIRTLNGLKTEDLQPGMTLKISRG